MKKIVMILLLGVLGGAVALGSWSSSQAKSKKDKAARGKKSKGKAARGKKGTRAIPQANWSGLLQKLDKIEAQGKDMKAQMNIVLINKAGKRRTRRAIFFQKGKDRRIIQFKYPASEAGLTVLIRGDNIHIYMPQFDRIRRIATHVKNQPFMGTDLSFDDMGSLQYGPTYKVVKGQYEGKKIHLVLKPRPGKSSGYSKLHLWIAQKPFRMVRVDYYDKRGRNHKRMTRLGFKKIKNYTVPMKTEMRDLRSGHHTLIILKKMEMDTGISSRFFSQRYLKRELSL